MNDSWNFLIFSFKNHYVSKLQRYSSHKQTILKFFLFSKLFSVALQNIFKPQSERSKEQDVN